MIPNRSIPSASVIPELGYQDVDGGHAWTFSQSVAFIDPETWGAVLVEPG